MVRFLKRIILPYKKIRMRHTKTFGYSLMVGSSSNLQNIVLPNNWFCNYVMAVSTMLEEMRNENL